MDHPAYTPEYLKYSEKPIGATYSSLNIGYYQDMDEIMNYTLAQNNLIGGK